VADLEHCIHVVEAWHAGGVDRRGRVRVSLRRSRSLRLDAGCPLPWLGTGGGGGLGGWRERLLRREPPRFCADNDLILHTGHASAEAVLANTAQQGGLHKVRVTPARFAASDVDVEQL
jgi:hypothetical protein